MPAPTINCAICGAATSKRQTLSLKELGGGDGRACRKHPEVVKLVEDAERNKQDKAAMEKAMFGIRHMMLVEQLRFLMTYNADYPALAAITAEYRMQRMGVPRIEIQTIIREAQEKGPWSEEEQLQAAIGAIDMMKRRKEWETGKATL